MTEESVIELAHVIFSKVSKYYGYSNFHSSVPILEIDESPYSDAIGDSFGEYSFSENVLVIYWKKIESKEDLIRTILHEYQHYLQSPIWYTRYFTMGYGYNNHPYEIAAYTEELNWKKFL